MKEEYIFKIRHILPRCIVVMLVTALVYGFLRWFVTFYLKIGYIKEEAWEFFLPVLIGITIFWILLSKPFRIIRECPNNNSGWRTYLTVFTIIPFCIILGLSQNYVVHCFSSQQSVENVSQIKHNETDTYYYVNEFAVDKTWMGYHIDNRTIPKRYSSDLQLSAYVVYPFIGCENRWYGIKYSKKIERHNEDYVNMEYQSFLNDCNTKIDTYDFNAVHSFERVVASDDMDGFIRAIKESGDKVDTKTLVVLFPTEKAFESKSQMQLAWILLTIVIWLTLITTLLVFAQLNEQLVTKQLTLRKDLKNDSFFVDLVNAAIIPRRDNWLLALILNSILIYYLVMVIGGVNPMSPSSIELFEWGALRSNAIEQGDWWRVVTSLFMHSDVKHLLLNLTNFGFGVFFLNCLITPNKTAIIFLVSGLIANFTAASLFPGVYVGASGGIMGVMGAVLSIYLFYRKTVQPEGLWLISIITGITLVVGITAGISNTAHITGLIIGAVVGPLIFYFQRKNNYNRLCR